MTGRKLKVCITLDPDVLSQIDREAKAGAGNRSSIIDRLLRRSLQREKLARLEAATAEYYDSLRREERAEDAAIAKASARAARRLRIDE